MFILAGLGAVMNTLGRRFDGYGVTRGASGGATRRKILWTMGSAALAAGAGAPATAAPPEVDARVVARHDAALENLLRVQVTDARHARVGGVPDEYGMFHAGAAGRLLGRLRPCVTCGERLAWLLVDIWHGRDVKDWPGPGAGAGGDRGGPGAGKAARGAAGGGGVRAPAADRGDR